MSRILPSCLCCVIVLVLAATTAADIIVTGPDGPYTIQQAITICQDGDVVELLDGVYAGDGNRDLRFGGRAITVRSQSGNPTACIIDCEGTPPDPHRGFLFDADEGLDSVVEGLTITGGYEYSGAGIFCPLGYPTVRNCWFVGNFATGDGGGLDAGGPTLVQDCWFIENEATGGGGAAVTNNYAEAAVFERCTFVGNIASGNGGAHRT